jgi:hypothetical protein
MADFMHPGGGVRPHRRVAHPPLEFLQPPYGIVGIDG